MAEQNGTPEEEVIVVEMEGPEGKQTYIQDIIIPYNGKKFAVLVSETDEDDALLTRIDTDEQGEEIYVSPEEEEFKAVQKLYDEMFEE